MSLEHLERRRRLSPVTVPDRDKVSLLATFAEILDSGHLSGGKYTAQFEQEFAAAHGVNYAVAVNSGTSALELSMRIVGVAGRSVALPSTTYVATAAAIINAGARPLLVDLDPDTLSLSNAVVDQMLDTDLAAVVTMHTGGYMAKNITTLAEICDARGVPLIEDAAHAHGASVGGCLAGSVGRMGAFSMFPTKVMTCGEGGMLLTNDEEIDRRARLLRDHGKLASNPDYQVVIGSSFRMSELDAALGVTQVRRLQTFVEARTRIAAHYDAALQDSCQLSVFRPGSDVTPSFYKYIVLLDEHVDRDEVRRLCAEHFDLSLPGLVYAVPLHRQPALQGHGNDVVQPGSDWFAAQHLCLPITPAMTVQDAAWVAECVGSAVQLAEGFS